MKIHESAENYLETILMLGNKLGQVRSIDIANELNFKKPSISFAMKQFRENGLINVSPEGFITLTPRGKSIAERILERHHVIADLLIAIGVEEKTALEDACRIEHDMSEETFERLKAHYIELTKN